MGVISVHLQKITVVGGDWLGLLIRGGDPWSEFLSTWQRWDALWYQQIAEAGYRACNGTAGFEPLYPFVVRAGSFLTFGHIVWSELLVSTACFIAAMVALYKLSLVEANHRVARLAVMLVALNPVGFFLLAPYTESMFLVLTVSSFLFARMDRPWLAGIAGFGAALTRLFGAILILPLAYEYLRHRDAQRRRMDIGLLASLLPAAGLMLATAYRRMGIGEPRTVIDISAPWGNKFLPPWEQLTASWSYIMRTGNVIEELNLACVLVSVVLLVAVVVKRLPLMYTLYAAPYLLWILTHEWLLSPFQGANRYVLVLFPVTLGAAIWLGRRQWLASGWLIVSTILMTTFFQYWVHFGFVA